MRARRSFKKAPHLPTLLAPDSTRERQALSARERSGSSGPKFADPRLAYQSARSPRQPVNLDHSTRALADSDTRAYVYQRDKTSSF